MTKTMFLFYLLIYKIGRDIGELELEYIFFLKQEVGALVRKN